MKHYRTNCRIYFTARNMMAKPTINLITFCGTYFWVFAPRYMPMNPPIPKRTPNGQSGMGDTPLVIGRTLKNNAPATEAINVPISVAPEMVQIGE
jgi:hypothetical protein